MTSDHYELERRLSAVERKMDQVLDAIKGNGLGVSKGLAGRMDDADESSEAVAARVQRLESWRQRIIWTAIGAGAGAGLGSSGLILVAVRLLGA